jgi:hypothetical protein
MPTTNQDDSVTDESLLVVEIGDEKAGGTDGQLLLDDVEFNKSRDNDMIHGIGNRTPQGVQRGNITYEVSASSHFNGSAASLAQSLNPRSVIKGKLYFRTNDDQSIVGEGGGNFELNFDLDWNDCTVEASDDGEVIVSVDFDGRTPTSDYNDDPIGSGGDGNNNDSSPEGSGGRPGV